MKIKQSLERYIGSSILEFGAEWITPTRLTILKKIESFMTDELTSLDDYETYYFSLCIEPMLLLFEEQNDYDYTINILRVIRAVPKQTVLKFGIDVERYRQSELIVEINMTPTEYADKHFDSIDTSERPFSFYDALQNNYLKLISLRNLTGIIQTM